MHLTLKKLLLKDENWYRYRQFYSEHGEIREIEFNSCGVDFIDEI